VVKILCIVAEGIIVVWGEAAVTTLHK